MSKPSIKAVFAPVMLGLKNHNLYEALSIPWMDAGLEISTPPRVLDQIPKEPPPFSDMVLYSRKHRPELTEGDQAVRFQFRGEGGLVVTAFDRQVDDKGELWTAAQFLYAARRDARPHDLRFDAGFIGELDGFKRYLRGETRPPHQWSDILRDFFTKRSVAAAHMFRWFLWQYYTPGVHVAKVTPPAQADA